jgi:WD40 repeat protein
VMSSTVEEFVRLSLLSWARGVSPYLLTIDYRVVSRALARLFLHAFTGASADKLCRIFTTAWENFGQARDWKSISNHTSWSITVTSQSGRMLESSGQASISLHMGNTRG